ncbi:MAG: PAS domain S-box protein [Candidatus Thermoplasmatota archaeon]|nr:PAS domain S-box protein [Candidatus Thermoplasmatota archaeon]
MQSSESSVIPDEKYRSFIENAGLGIITLNSEGVHEKVNSAFCGITGFEKHEIIGQKIPPSYWPTRFIKELKEEIKRMQTSGFIRTQSYFQRRNHDIFPVSITGSIVFDPNNCKKEYILLIDDITEIKKNERELRLTTDMLVAVNNKLEKKIKERTEQVESLIKQKDEFINQLGHDLKNPLTPIINLLPVIEGKLIDETSKEIIDVVKRNAIYMRDLVLKTIQLARLDSPNVIFNFEYLDLKELIKEIIKNLEIVFKNHNIEIETKIDEFTIKADRLRFDELIRNLLDNAVKYSQTVGKIVIEAKEKPKGFVQIKIIDNGIGMTQEQISHIFEDFYRADPKIHDFKSSGLGMPICKKIVEKHGGKIWVESQGLNKGTKIIFKIPLKENEKLNDEI